MLAEKRDRVVFQQFIHAQGVRADDRIVGVRDYTHCPWMILAATSFDVSLAGVEP